MKFLLTLALAFVSCFAFSQTNWKVHKVRGYTMSYPDTWQKDFKDNFLYFISPRTDSTDKFSENVNFTVQDLSSQPMTQAQYTEFTKTQLIDQLGATILLQKDTLLANQKATHFIYTAKSSGIDLKIEQYWFVLGEEAYLFTYTATPDQFRNYRPIANSIITSFKFTDAGK